MTGHDGNLPLWRSMLFVPATSERFAAKAHTRGADAIIVDLEDSIAASEKGRARSILPQVLRQVGQGGADVVVRINRPVRLAVRDLEVAVVRQVQAISLPKTESASHVELMSEVMAEIEADRGLTTGDTRIIALIETVEGFANLSEIAAHPRVVAVTLGGEDFAAALGMPSAEAEQMRPYLREIVLAARGAGKLALGYAGSIANFSNLDGYAADIAEARAMGFDGGSCIHPAQVPVLNKGFAPSAEEIIQAERVAAAYDRALAEGQGAIQLDGRMIDVPVAERARAILATRDRIAARV
ncbi:MAG: CoA ester lyase [Pseudomonadota bacterium]